MQSLWRIPVDDIDRCGSFASKLMNAMLLLIDVLTQLHDWDNLFYVYKQMARAPELEKYVALA